MNRFAVEDNLENSGQIKGSGKSENEAVEGVTRGLPEASEKHVADAAPPDGSDPDQSTVSLNPGEDFDFLSSTRDFSAGAGKPIDSHLPNGAVIGEKYLILGFLGEGGMSSVYKAKHILTGKIVALKVMHGRLLNDASSFRRFHQEAIASSRLDHPNAISVSDMGAAGSQPYLVMDFIDGRSLAQVIREEGRLDVERALSIFIQAALGLGSAHKLGIVHRDLKPSNIMLVRTAEGNEIVKIVDFGIAKIIAQEGESQKLTATGEVFGSPLYMSPEQCGGKSLDARSDMYSMGCLMYEALTGRPPFYGENVMSTLLKHLNEEPPRLSDLEASSAVQNLLNNIVSKALSKDPEKRQKDMFQLVAELTEVVEVQTGAKRAPHLLGLANLKQQLKKTALPLVLIAVPVIAIALLLTSAEFGIGDSPPREKRVIYPTAINIAGVGPPSQTSEKPLPTVLKQFMSYEDQVKICKRAGLTNKAQGRYVDAVTEFNSAIGALYPAKLGDSLESAEMSMNIAECAMYLGRYKEAVSQAEKALRKLEGVGNPIQNWEDRCKSVIAYSYWRRGSIEQAREIYQSLWDWHSMSGFGVALSGQAPADFAFHLTATELFFAHQGLNSPSDYDKAMELYKAANDRLKAVTASSRSYERAVTFNLGAIKNARGLLNEMNGHPDEAAADFQAAANCFSEAKGDSDIALASVLFNQADLSWRRKKWFQALVQRGQARTVWQHSKYLDR